MTGVLNIEREDAQRHREEGCVKREAETGVIQLQAKEHQGGPAMQGAWREARNRVSPRAIRFCSDFGLLTSRTEHE